MLTNSKVRRTQVEADFGFGCLIRQSSEDLLVCSDFETFVSLSFFLPARRSSTNFWKDNHQALRKRSLGHPQIFADVKGPESRRRKEAEVGRQDGGTARRRFSARWGHEQELHIPAPCDFQST